MKSCSLGSKCARNMRQWMIQWSYFITITVQWHWIHILVWLNYTLFQFLKY